MSKADVCPTCGAPNGHNKIDVFEFCFKCQNLIPPFFKPKYDVWGEKFASYKRPREICYHPILARFGGPRARGGA
jgi:hypothetical protein